ncbi:hypothetical protein ACWIGI_15925 [Nocardia sp. NPDC055321]
MRSKLLTTVAGMAIGLPLLAVAAAPAAARPVFTPEPGGVIRVESDPGEWWKCAFYSVDDPRVVGVPPAVNYPPGSWAYPDGRLPEAGTPPAPNFATPPSYAVFQPGSTVVADCISEYLPIVWLEVLRAGD